MGLAAERRVRGGCRSRGLGGVGLGVRGVGLVSCSDAVGWVRVVAAAAAAGGAKEGACWGVACSALVVFCCCCSVSDMAVYLPAPLVCFLADCRVVHWLLWMCWEANLQVTPMQ